MKITTHVLDTASGRPAENVFLVLTRLSDGVVLAERRTNADGRLDSPLLEGAAHIGGVFEIAFHAGDYLRAAGIALPDTPFLDVIPIRFGISEDAHYHVPLLLSPYGFSTYRGS